MREGMTEWKPRGEDTAKRYRRTEAHAQAEGAGRGPKEKVYLAGRITGDELYKVKFGAVQVQLEAAGMIVLNPAALTGGFAYGAYMRMTGAMLAECDAVCMLPDWLYSKGAILEYQAAEKLGKRIFLFEPWEWERKEHHAPVFCKMQRRLGRVSPSIKVAKCLLGVRPLHAGDCRYCKWEAGHIWTHNFTKGLYEREGAKGGCDLEHQTEAL